jgi:chromosome segregation ATPase
MTNYNLEEFKQWLEENPEKKVLFEDCGLDILQVSSYWEELITAAKGMAQPGGSWTADLHKKHRQTAQEWISRVDNQRERERESREEERDNMPTCIKCGKKTNDCIYNNAWYCPDCYQRQQEVTMINIQQWLQEKFPTKENREAVKELMISRNSKEFQGGRGRRIVSVLSKVKREFYDTTISGELDLSDFINLERLEIIKQLELTAVKGLENCLHLINLTVVNCPKLQLPYTFLDSWKQEIEQLKNQLAEYEQSESSTSMPGSWTETTSDPNEPLDTKIQRKKQELTNLRTGSRKSTAPLRKEIELLEKIQNLENKIKEQTQKEAKYQEWLEAKDQRIAAKLNEVEELEQAKKEAETNLNGTIGNLNQQIDNLKKTSEQDKAKLQGELATLKTQKQTSEQTITNLRQDITNLTNTSKKEKETLQAQIKELKTNLTAKTEAETQALTKITQLEKQIQNLNTEKASLQEKMLQERQQAFQEWEQEKTNLTQQITQLNEQKDTFQKSADYLRSTLKDTENELQSTKTKLTDTETQSQQASTSHQTTLQQKDEELTKKQEAYALIQERNTDLQAKLQAAQEEISKLTEWISKLEAASAEGNAFETLQKELAAAQSQIALLQDQLTAKHPKKNYLWLYAILALVALYFLMS